MRANNGKEGAKKRRTMGVRKGVMKLSVKSPALILSKNSGVFLAKIG